MKIVKNIPKECPSCGGDLDITELRCSNCDTIIKGEYSLPAIIRLKDDEMEFLYSFLKARGNIKEVERLLKISYPTVKARLESLLASLGIKEEASSDYQESILDAIDRGEIKVDEAIKLLKKQNFK